MEKMDYEVLYEGEIYTIEISEEVIEFLNNHKVPEKDRARVVSILERLADKGKIFNKQIFRHEEDGIYAVKSNQVRVYSWFSNRKINVVVAAHTALKKQQKANPRDLERTKRLREEYEEK